MGDELTTFTIRDIPRKSWDCLVSKIDRKYYNEKKDKYENLTLEQYFRRLIIKLSLLNREQISEIIGSKKIKFE